MDRPLGTRPPMKDYADTTIRVRYAETDQMGIVYYGNYLTWFEIGRVELCRQLGFEYKRMEIDDDSFIIVAEARCRYKKPARFDDVLLIRTRVTQSQRRTLRFGYEILHRDSGELLATGETMHVICDHRGRPKSLPEKYRAYFPATPPTREPSPVPETVATTFAENVATTVAQNVAEDVAEDPA
jgi:acyl-CoA thioester hydrolase